MGTSFKGVDSIASFDAEFVLEALRATMVMGLPENDSDKPTFWFDPTASWTSADAEGNPWDWTEVPDNGSLEPTQKQVICAYEFTSPFGRQGAGYTEVGEFNPNTLELTMFEDEFKEVYGFAYVTLGPPDASGERTKFYIRFWSPVMGFGEANVYQVICVAEGTP